ncbi:hypothetical protein PQ478_08700 [Alkalihalophilus pseudofirmus]|uniref:hypothetical protein n=1 Tax=Alkalihalophilus pseudofirmus TaxID=79885 RepID=UPI00259B5435|nr:hypothetical protein [Alkalihalophilus pseudofirmus]WEG18548.1 hypothetical protein PQ478_08700 [Alkalihalophilus pseudofirmus]
MTTYTFDNIDVYKKGDLKGYVQGLITFSSNETESTHEFLYRTMMKQTGKTLK